MIDLIGVIMQSGDPPPPFGILGTGNKPMSSSLGHDIDPHFPSGTSVGDLILVCTWTGGSHGGVVNSGTGWTTHYCDPTVGNIKSGVFWKVLDGTGDNLRLGTSVSTTLGAIIYRIGGCSLVETAQIATLSTLTPDPPSLTPSMTGDRLWFAAAMVRSTRTLGTAPNGDYGGRLDLGNPGISIVTKTNGDATEDPGTFAYVSGTAAAADAWTIAVGNP